LAERKPGTTRPLPDKGVKKNQMILLETGSPQAAWLKTIRARRRTKKIYIYIPTHGVMESGFESRPC